MTSDVLSPHQAHLLLTRCGFVPASASGVYADFQVLVSATSGRVATIPMRVDDPSFEPRMRILMLVISEECKLGSVQAVLEQARLLPQAP